MPVSKRERRLYAGRRDSFLPFGTIMQRHHSIFSAAVAAGAVLGINAASAADLPMKAPPMPVPVMNWTGFYGGFNGGGAWSDPRVTYSPNDTAAAGFMSLLSIGNDSVKTSGVLGGLQLGYNYQFDRKWLIGLETDFDGADMKGSGAQFFSGGSVFSATEQRVDWFGTARVRLGYLPTPDLVTYITGGLAYGSVANSGAFTAGANDNIIINSNGIGAACSSPPGNATVNNVPIVTPTCFAGASRNTGTGWTLGGGLEYAFWQRWTIKAEYLYVNLGSRSVTEIGSPNPAAPVLSTLNASFHTNFNVARFGVNYHF